MKIRIGKGALLAGLLGLALSAQDASGDAGSPRAAVVGTFDSRAVAVAYIRSEATRAYLHAQMEDVARVRERALEAGDTELVRELDALGPAMQERFHRMGFGTAPVDGILARVAGRLPEVAAEAGVDAIVSKWELDWVDPDTEPVDVTDRLAALFEPSEETWKAIHEIVRQEPVPVEELDDHEGGHH